MFCRSVHLVEEDASSRRDIIRALGALEVEAWPFPGAATFLAMLSHLPPAPVLFGIRTDAPAEGLALLDALAARGLDWPAVAMSAETDTRSAVEAMKRGAIDFLELPVRPERLEEALSAAADLFERSARARAVRLAAAERLAALSPRELEVARALARGMGNKTVAHHLALSVRTIEMHRSKLLRKLEVRTLAEAAVLLAQAEPPAATVRPRIRRPQVEARTGGPPPA
jgi:FixJ family two-component response regulator